MTNEILLIEDDVVTNFVNKIIIKSIFPGLPISIFYNGIRAFNYILENPNTKYLIFLDINMPVMNGWEFLEALLPTKEENQLQIHMLSSSIDEHDRLKAEGHPLVKSFIKKPLKHNDLNKISIV